MKSLKTKIVTIAIVLVAYPACAQISLIANGSFEDFGPTSSMFFDSFSGASFGTSWQGGYNTGTSNLTVSNWSYVDTGSATSEWVNINYGTDSVLNWGANSFSFEFDGALPALAQDGSVFLRLDSLARLEQPISTVIGEEYTVNFYIGATNLYGTSLQTAKLYLNGVDTADFSVTPLSGPGSGAVWEPFSYSFVASSTSTLIGFGGSSGSDIQKWTMLDNVSVVAVPETSAALLGLIGLTGFLIRRRR